MTCKKLLFPVLEGKSLTGPLKLTEITRDILPRLEDALLLRRKAKTPFTHREEGLACLYRVGPHIALPLTFIGAPLVCRQFHHAANKTLQPILVHSPGLPGAFHVPMDELLSCRGQFTSVSDTVSVESQQLGSLCLMEVLEDCLQDQGRGVGSRIMESLYLKARRRHFSASGTICLIMQGDKVNLEALRLDFPYHTGGAHALKRYMDIRNEACQHFCRYAPHGTKVLSRYGSAVSVGVAVDETLRTPCLYWHAYGAQAACIAPVLHSCHYVPVDRMKLQLNGPTTSCEFTRKEDIRRYMNADVEGLYDSSRWLCEGLFGVRPGQTWESSGSTCVLGVGFNESAAEFELVLKENNSGSLFFADDLSPKD